MQLHPDELIEVVKMGNVSAVRGMLAQDTALHLNGRDEKGWTALHHAARNGHQEIIKVLLSCSASVDCSTAGGGTSGATPLMLAANFAHSAVCRQLLEAGASLSREAQRLCMEWCHSYDHCT